jgi:hypothetical protein
MKPNPFNLYGPLPPPAPALPRLAGTSAEASAPAEAAAAASTPGWSVLRSRRARWSGRRRRSCNLPRLATSFARLNARGLLRLHRRRTRPCPPRGAGGYPSAATAPPTRRMPAPPRVLWRRGCATINNFDGVFLRELSNKLKLNLKIKKMFLTTPSSPRHLLLSSVDRHTRVAQRK